MNICNNDDSQKNFDSVTNDNVDDDVWNESNQNILIGRSTIFFTEIHSHCADCIHPVKCIKKPNFFPNLFSNQKVFSLILNVNYFCDEINGLAHKNLDYCPVVRCTNGDCNVITHYCKLQEHYLLCQYQLVSVIELIFKKCLFH